MISPTSGANCISLSTTSGAISSSQNRRYISILLQPLIEVNLCAIMRTNLHIRLQWSNQPTPVNARHVFFAVILHIFHYSLRKPGIRNNLFVRTIGNETIMNLIHQFRTDKSSFPHLTCNHHHRSKQSISSTTLHWHIHTFTLRSCSLLVIRRVYVWQIFSSTERTLDISIIQCEVYTPLFIFENL